MNSLLIYGSVEKIPFYNCTWKSEEEWWQTGQTRPWLGWPLLIFGIFVESLYLPIIYIIFRSDLIKYVCYKIIVMLAIVDSLATVTSSFITGIFLLQGAVFYVYPTFFYVVGSISLGLWTTSCGCTFFLFVNRMTSVSFPGFAARFEYKIGYCSIAICLFYFTCTILFSPTVCYNSLVIAWLPDPLSEKIPSEEASKMYHSSIHLWNNYIFASCMFVFYTLYFMKVKKLARGQTSNLSKTIFIQCIIICFFNTVCALVYNAITIVTPAPWVVVLGQVFWSVNHGCPAIIYVTFNHTIRREFRFLIFRTSNQLNDQSAPGSVAATTRSKTQK